ncbi:IucA/IucC family protein [Vibrio paucivorans]
MNRHNDQLNRMLASNDAPAACFLNALARECNHISYQHGTTGTQYQIPLSQGRTINIPLAHYSLLGGHEYEFPAQVTTAQGEDSELITFHQLIELILEEPALVGVISDQQKQIFIDRVRESYTNTCLAAEGSPYGEALFQGPLNFSTAEQGLLIGHSFHPAPKSREQFSQQDAQKYTPEFGACFPLVWLAASRDITLAGSSAGVSVDSRIEELLCHDHALQQAVENVLERDEVLLPAHPWQWQVMSELESIQTYLEQGKLRVLGEFGAEWYPTSSTRSLYAPNLPYMLKFSLSVKLTNSIRNLSLKEVIRGTRLNNLFESTSLSENLGNGEGFQLMQEPAYLGLVDLQGNAVDESFVAFRDNPLKQSPEQEAVVLATLTQQNPYGGSSLLASRVAHLAAQTSTSIQDCAEHWFSAYCQHTVVPLFNLQANYGVVFLAHQQNIVMQLEQGLPVGMYYRDCQGTGYTDLAFELFSEQLSDAKQDVENYWNEDKVRRYFAYYLIINSTFNVISSLSAGCDISEAKLIEILHDHLAQLLDSGVKDDKCLRYVLNSDALCCKGNFFCYLQNFNENSIPDPSVIYFDLDNPLATVKELSHA